jgi:PhnB protein
MARAQQAGATITLPASDVFWGARYGRLRDPFGHVWAFNAPLKTEAVEPVS